MILSKKITMIDENYQSTPWDAREDDQDECFDEVYYDDLRHGNFD